MINVWFETVQVSKFKEQQESSNDWFSFTLIDRNYSSKYLKAWSVTSRKNRKIFVHHLITRRKNTLLNMLIKFESLINDKMPWSARSHNNSREINLETYEERLRQNFKLSSEFLSSPRSERMYHLTIRSEEKQKKHKTWIAVA